MKQVKFAELPLAVRVLLGLAAFNLWWSFEEFVVDRFGIWRYLPDYKFGRFCVWDLGVVLCIVSVIAWRSWRPVRE